MAQKSSITTLPRRSARFTLLPCADGVCNQSGNAMQFTLAPYYYQKGWFLPLCAGFLALVAGLAHGLRVRRVREQLGLVMTERIRIARELHDTLIQGFSGITLHLVSSRYERAGVIVTSNKPFGRWGEVFGDAVVAAAMIDRLVHHAEVVSMKGDSYRLKDRDLGKRVPTDDAAA